MTTKSQQLKPVPRVCLILASSCLFCSLAPAATTVNFTGSVGAGEGVVGHGALAPIPAPFDDASGSRLGTHPQTGVIVTIYTLLTGRDVFNTTDGSEVGLSAHAPPFASSATGSPLSALGIDGNLYYSFRGLQLDTDSPSDYRYDTVNDLEYRIYRGGTFEFYHDPGGGPVTFARTEDAQLALTIDWNTFAVDLEMSGTAVEQPGMLALVASGTGVSGAPVDESGSTTENGTFTGQFGLYNESGSFNFEQIPEPATPALAGLGLALWAVRRRRG